MRNFKLLFVLILLSTQLAAIDVNRKFGKVSKEELLMEYYDKDSSASAVILFDIGNTGFQYDENKGFVMVYERQVRIKILKKDGFSYGDFSISLYNKGENNEKIVGLKAYTYNLENGKIVKEKLDRNDIYMVKDSKTNKIKKFSLPSIREGSVIEVKYTIRSDFYYNLQEWKFQHYIPTMWSEYAVEIPEYFKYNKIATGYIPFVINKTGNKSDFITLTYKAGITEQRNTTTEKIDFQTQVIQLAAKDVPAMKNEAFMLSANNFISKVKYELARTKFPGGYENNYTETWESINKILLKHSDFGQQIKNRIFINEVVEDIKSSTKDPEKQIQAFYNYLIRNYKWNGKQSILTSQNLRETYKTKTGNTADINLMMLLLLKEAGFDADPVVLSTRAHGLLNPIYPSLSQMNYVVTLLKYKDEDILIDATDPECKLGVLPPKCINDKGRVISTSNSKWINIEPKEKYSSVLEGNFIISENEFKGDLVDKKTGFASYNFRKKYNKFNNNDEYIADLESDNSGFTFNGHEIINLDSIHKPVQEKFTDLVFDSYDNLGNLIYFNPVLFDKLKENPFKLEERKYPINYNYLYNQKYIFNYTIPEGYIVDEAPKNELIELPEGSLKYRYQISTSGNKIQVTVHFLVNKRLFIPPDYNMIKDFYNKIIEKENEQIVLKKS